MASWTQYLNYPVATNNTYVCGVPFTIRWTVMLFSGTLSDLDNANQRIWFRIYNADHPEYTPIDLGPAMLSAQSYTHLLGITPDGGWSLFSWYAGGTAPTERAWSAQSKLQLQLVAPAAPDKPVFSARRPARRAIRTRRSR
jgi:hypothetical protein